MNAVLQRDLVQNYCDKQISKSNVFINEYFLRLRNNEMTLEEFRLSQEQFYYAVSFFSRPMSALMARFPLAGSRMSILENIVEEHGSFKESALHERTFCEFLKLISVDTSRIEDVILWPEIRAFNSALMTACVFDEPEVGVGCLGAIEYMFASISGIIGKAVVENQWCKESELTHYKLHSDLDLRHAADFFQIVEESWHDSEKKYFIKQGVDMGIYIFNRLYLDLSARAKSFLYNK